MSSKRDDSKPPETRIIDTGIHRLPRLPAVSWGGGGDYGCDSRSGVGTSVGIGAGTSVGIGVGTSVGIGAGTSVGIGAGTSVGIGAGTSVGIGAGTSVGIGAGTSVGIGTGTSVGVGVGTSVGVGAGTDAGAGGGLADGGFAMDTAGAALALRQALLLARQQELLSVEATRSQGSHGDRLTPRDLWKTVRITQPTLSPCGEWVAFVKLERPAGGALQHERIYLKRVGSAAGDDEFPLTDNTVLADTPVWKPNLWRNGATEETPGGSSAQWRKTEILFRARATAADVLQLYVVQIELPPDDVKELRIGAVRRLTNGPTHPWAPKWRRFDHGGREQNRIYYVAASPEASPPGYDHLVYDSALVGWWDNLRLPHGYWRFYEIDACTPGAPRDLLGPNQPLLDFVNGVWGCWDVHPGGEEMVWTAVDQNDENHPADWPNDISMDIFRMRLRHRPNLTATEGGSQSDTMDRVMGVTSNIFDGSPAQSPNPGRARRGQKDDYSPMYSPDGSSIIYAEKQYSTLDADYPRLIRLHLNDRNKYENNKDVYDLIERKLPQNADDNNATQKIGADNEKDSDLPIAWRFSGTQELIVLVEENGEHKLKTLNIKDKNPAPLKPMSSVKGELDAFCRDKSSDPSRNKVDETLDFGQKGGAVHDFDVTKTKRGQTIAAITSGIATPPELLSCCASQSDNVSETKFNKHLMNKVESIDVGQIRYTREKKSELRHPNPTCIHRSKLYGLSADKIQVWIVYPKEPNSGEGEGPCTTKKYPLIQLLHGGPHSAWIDEFHMRFNASLLASQGYVVAMVNFRGSTGTTDGEPGTTFEDGEGSPPDDNGEGSPHSDPRGWGAALPDVDWVTTRLSEEKFVDKDRIAVIGASYGAYLGARLLGWKERNRENKYRAYILHAGVYDPLSHYATDVFWVQHGNFGARPWVRPGKGSSEGDGDPHPWERFSGISPLLRSEGLVEDVKAYRERTGGETVPPPPAVLLTHGLNDLRVHWQQSVLMHRMLLDRGVRSRLALYPGLGHRLDQPEPSVQWWTAALAWLKEHHVPPGGIPL